MSITSPEIPQPNYIKPIITISEDGVMQITETYQVFEQQHPFKRVLKFFEGKHIGEIKDPNLEQVFQNVSLLAQIINEDSPSVERDSGLFLKLLSSLNNLLEDSNKQLTSEEKKAFNEIFFKYLQGEKGILKGIDDGKFYADLRNNKEPIFALLKEGKVDLRFVIVLNYALLAYRDWLEQRLSLQRQPQVSNPQPLTRRIKEAEEVRKRELQKAAKELRELFGKGGVGLEEMREMISKKAKELQRRGIRITKEELEKRIKEMVESEKR
jgi:hypothetical protein